MMDQLSVLNPLPIPIPLEKFFWLDNSCVISFHSNVVCRNIEGKLYNVATHHHISCTDIRYRSSFRWLPLSELQMERIVVVFINLLYNPSFASGPGPMYHPMIQ